MSIWVKFAGPWGLLQKCNNLFIRHCVFFLLDYCCQGEARAHFSACVEPWVNTCALTAWAALLRPAKLKAIRAAHAAELVIWWSWSFFGIFLLQLCRKQAFCQAQVLRIAKPPLRLCAQKTKLEKLNHMAQSELKCINSALSLQMRDFCQLGVEKSETKDPVGNWVQAKVQEKLSYFTLHKHRYTCNVFTWVNLDSSILLLISSADSQFCSINV